MTSRHIYLAEALRFRTRVGITVDWDEFVRSCYGLESALDSFHGRAILDPFSDPGLKPRVPDILQAAVRALS